MEKPQQNPDHPAPKVLIVEDISETALVIKKIIERHGYQVSGLAKSYEEALASASLTPPDIAICDINLADYKDGIMAAKALKSRFGIPIIYLTALDDEDIIQRADQETEHVYYLLKNSTLMLEGRQLAVALQLTLLNKHKLPPEEPENTLVSNDQFIDVWVLGEIDRVQVKDILYLEAINMSTRIVTTKKELLARSKNIGKILEEINHEDIIQCHRSFAFNRTKISGYEKN
ncbi:MAG: response regulator [Bacteroidia bacterium]|nr:response regulator [Bacteroidia bacterium]